MKREIVLTSVVLILVIIALLLFHIKTPLLISKKDGIIMVSVNSLPEGFSYSFDGESADAIVEYLSNIKMARLQPYIIQEINSLKQIADRGTK